MLSAFKLSMGEKYLAVLKNALSNCSRDKQGNIERNTKGGHDWNSFFIVVEISDIAVMCQVCTRK